MARPVYLHGRALASALGTNLDAAMVSVDAGPVRPQPLEAAPGNHWPYYAIPVADEDGSARAAALVRTVMADSGADAWRDAPLILASSSLNVGALETGAPFLPDCQAFVEQLAGGLDWRGPLAWVSTACTSALVALLDACALVRTGQAEQVVVLGLELANRFSCAGFGAMQLLDAHSARPLAVDRGGLVLGEAVAALVVGAQPARWRLCGGANRVDGANPAGAHRDAVSDMVRAALADSGLTAGDIDRIKLQAAGSPMNDAEELIGLRAVFDSLPELVSLKAAIGHTLGAAGAAELALLTACIEHGRWPEQPAITPDPALGACCVAPTAPARHTLLNILGFGGGHAGVILEDRTVSS